MLLQTGIAGAAQRLMAMFSGTMDATLTQVDTIFLAQIKWGKEVQVLGGLKDTGYRATGGDIMAAPPLSQGQGRSYSPLSHGDRGRNPLVAHAQRSRLENAQPTAQGGRPANTRSGIEKLRH